jgi:CRISPR-associated protein Cas1
MAKKIGTVPVEDIGALILANPAIVITQYCIIACLENMSVLVFCDRKFLPISVLLPLIGNSLHSKILNEQIQTKKPLHKKVWKQIVRAKIQTQASVLKSIKKQYRPLEKMALRVKSGDPENLEALAARYYWKTLFGKGFRRKRDIGGANTLLNYGYAILRASTARAICATGLNPSLGIHHHNQYDNLCLADDLIEPLRPIIDFVVFNLVSDKEIGELEAKHKESLLSVLNILVTHNKKQFPLSIAIQNYAASFKSMVSGNGHIQEINIPFVNFSSLSEEVMS